MERDDRLERELKYHRKIADELTKVVRPVSQETIVRYARTRDWKYFEKEAVFHYIKKCIFAKKHVDICDFGCGDGIYACQVALANQNVNVIGIDVSPDLIALARKNAEINKVADRVKFVLADAESYSAAGGSFDLILVLNVLHHLELQAAMSSLIQIAKPGGAFIIQEPIAFSSNLQALRDRLPVPKDVSPDERQLSLTEVEYIQSLLKVERIHYFNLLGRLGRLIPDRMAKWKLIVQWCLNFVDHWLFKLAPILTRYAGRVLIVASSKERGAADLR